MIQLRVIVDRTGNKEDLRDVWGRGQKDRAWWSNTGDEGEGKSRKSPVFLASGPVGHL